MKFDPAKTCIVKPLFRGSRLFEFSCGHGAFILADVSLPKVCPFCKKPVNSLTDIDAER